MTVLPALKQSYLLKLTVCLGKWVCVHFGSEQNDLEYVNRITFRISLWMMLF